jgi:asparagine synthase (glutamine-hydrolysing)
MSLVAALYSRAAARHEEPITRMFPANCTAVPVEVETGSSPDFSYALSRPPYVAASAPVAVYRDASRNFTLLLVGRLFNAHEIAAQLPGAPADAAALAAAAYARWGVASFEKFRGQFALIICDAKERTVLAVRDRFGAAPLYFRILDNGIAIASLAKQLLALDEGNAAANEALIWNYLTDDLATSHIFSSEQTFFQGVQRVLPGHYLRYADGRCEQRRYWDCVDFISQDKNPKPDPQEYLALLENVVREQCGDFKGVGSSLSGGLDSTAVAMLMDRLRHGDDSMPTISLDIDGMDEVEASNIRLVLDQVKAKPAWANPDQSNMFELFRESTWHQEAPSMSPSLSIFYFLKKSTRAAGIDILFSGLGADEVLGGMNLGYLSDLFRSGQWRRMYQELSAYTRVDSLHLGRSKPAIFRAHVFDPLATFRRRRPVPHWINRDFAAIHDQDKPYAPMAGRSGQSAFDLRTRDKLMQSFTQFFLHCEIHNGAACALEHRFPYLDPRLVEYCLRLPWHERMAGGVYKIHHRKALASLLPPAVLTQPRKTAVHSVHDRWLCETYRDEVDDLIYDANAGWTRYLDKDVVRAEHREYQKATDFATKSNLRRSTWRAVGLELWQRAFQL